MGWCSVWHITTQHIVWGIQKLINDNNNAKITYCLTVRDPTDKRTFWLKPWVLEHWFCGFESLDHLYVSCLSTYIHVLIFLMTTSDLRSFFLSRSTSKTLIKEGLDTTQYLVTNLEDDTSQVAYTTVSVLLHYIWSHVNWLPCNLHVLLSNFDWN